jgi:hypothetical protein
MDSNKFLSKSRRARFDITHYWLIVIQKSSKKNIMIA